jgi:hypothetical protein
MAIPGRALVSLLGKEVGRMAKPAKPLHEDPLVDEESIPYQPLLKHPIVGRLDRASLYKPQGPDSGINAIIGKWPGDESDEEILALLEELS